MSSKRTLSHASVLYSPQIGQGKYQCSLVDPSISRSMWLAPLIPGLETITAFRFQNALVRATASWIGFPSVPALAGYRSTSSNNTTRTGRPLKLDALFAPPIATNPPLKLFRLNVLVESLARGSATRSRNRGESRIIGANRSVENASPNSIVG